MHRELLKALLLKNNIEYSCIDIKPAAIQPDFKIIQYLELAGELLFCENNSVLALYPADRKFNLPKLNKAVCRDLKNMPHSEYVALKLRLLKHDLPELNIEKGVYIFIDEALKAQQKVYMRDKNDQVIIIDSDELYKLSSDKLIGITFSENIITKKEIQPPHEF